MQIVKCRWFMFSFKWFSLTPCSEKSTSVYFRMFWSYCFSEKYAPLSRATKNAYFFIVQRTHAGAQFINEFLKEKQCDLMSGTVVYCRWSFRLYNTKTINLPYFLLLYYCTIVNNGKGRAVFYYFFASGTRSRTSVYAPANISHESRLRLCFVTTTKYYYHRYEQEARAKRQQNWYQ